MRIVRTFVVGVAFLFLVEDLARSQPPARGLGGEREIRHGELSCRFAFGPELRDIGLVRFENVTTGTGFDFVREPLWEIEWIDLQTGEVVHADSSSSFGRASLEERRVGSDRIIDLRWPRCRLGARTFAVSIRVRLPAAGSLSEWTIEVDATGILSHAVQSAEIALGIRPPAQGTSFGILPYRGTLLLEDPHELLSNQAGPVPTSKLALQLFPYFTSSGDGLYLAAHDPAWDYKTLHLDGDGRRYHVGVRFHGSDLVTPGQRFVATAPLIVGTFEGDWFDAAQIYRGWARGQSWLARGPLKTRTDVPLWWKELELYEGHTFAPGDDPAAVVAAFDEVRAFYGVQPGRMALQLWAWFDGFGPYRPLPGFTATVQGLAARGIRVMPYVWSFGYDPQDPSYVTNGIEPLTKKDFFGGTVIDHSFPGRPAAVVDPSRPAWHDHLAGVAGSIGVDAVYLDNPFEVSPCFDASHGHRGFGRDIHGGFHDLMQSMRSQVRVSNPDFVLGWETAFEGYLDASEWIEPDAPYMPNPIETDGRARFVSLLEAIYHDYAPVFYSNEKADYFRALQSRRLRDIFYTLAEGFTLGRVVNSVESHFEEGGPLNHQHSLPVAQEYVSMLRLYIDTRRAQREFLIYGQMMRPMETSAETTLKELRDPRRRRFYFVPVESILSSVWKATDGRVGILLTNYEPPDDALTFTLRFADADLLVGQQYDLIDAVTGKVLRTVADDFTQTADVPGLGLRFFVLRKNG